MRGAVCTAYSSSGGRGGLASVLLRHRGGKPPRHPLRHPPVHHLAGPKLAVYGFAIATDTGGAMMEGRGH